MITRDKIAELSQLSSTEWPVVSFFLRIDKERIDDDHTIRLRNLLRDAESTLDEHYSHEQREALKSDLERIREYLRDHRDQHGRGIAIFASAQADIWEVHDVPREIESCVSIDSIANVGPLIRVMEQLEPFCTCIITRDRARLFYGQLGEFEELLETRDETVPGQHEQGGWSQARFERHVEEHVRGHFKQIADQLFQLAQERPYRFLILAGPEEVVAGFVEMLHPYVKERHIGTVRLLLEANINDVHQESAAIINRWLRGEKDRALEMLRGEVLSSDLGVSGLDRTVAALQQGQILSLVVDSTFKAPGAVCLECGSVQPPSQANPETCLYCGGTLRQVDNIVDEITVGAFKQGAKVFYLDEPEQQQQAGELGHIGAILRFALTPADAEASG